MTRVTVTGNIPIIWLGRSSQANTVLNSFFANFVEPIIRQVAALPYQIDERGETRVLLVTSRGTGRWVIPKGNRIPGLPPHEAAAREAFEEAGIHGVAATIPLGVYRYEKRRKNGATRSAVVKVFALAFDAQAVAWPEQDQRQTRWFSLADAAAVVAEPELKLLIEAFAA